MESKNMKRYAGILVKCGDEVLLCKRNNNGDLPGQWSIPCGHLNEGETPRQGAIREFYEETYLKADNDIKLLGMITRYTRDGIKVKGLMYVFLMEVDKKIIPDLNKAKDGGEHTETGYFGVNDLPLHKSDQLGTIVKNLLNK
jgi:ADP-ribose pyrophosphatase YjhB (NUDIX family)